MMKKLIIVAMIIGFTCQARIGETEEQCNERYGKPYALFKGIYYYKKKDDSIIGAVFLDKTCQEIFYYKLPRDKIKMKLKLNSNTEWTQIGNNIWEDKDTVLAYYSENTLIIQTREARDAKGRVRGK